MQAPATGRYRHFKGGYYQVLALALHTETQEQLVIYQSEQDGQVYARPVAFFMSSGLTDPDWLWHRPQNRCSRRCAAHPGRSAVQW